MKKVKEQGRDLMGDDALLLEAVKMEKGGRRREGRLQIVPLVKPTIVSCVPQLSLSAHL